ncbi:MAG: sulfatase [Candidatus Hydrogenedentes bacterium]|nr:sulfatase [Candidatus Hydrogenedentota bacterium]
MQERSVPGEQQRIQRREFLRSAAVAVGMAGVVSSGTEAGRYGAAAATTTRPNLVVLLTDDHRWDAMGCAGNEIVQTPNMDRLAAEGVRFTNCFATTAICMASRASILTGMYVTTHGIEDFARPFSPELFALTHPAQLRAAGYYTGFVGKWGVGNVMPAEAFDYWDGFPGQGKYFQEVNGQTRHLESLLGESACRAIAGAPGDKPFCLSVSFKAPHVQDEDPRQYLYDPELEPLYQDVEIPAPMTADPKYFAALPKFVQESEGRRRWEKRFATPEMYQRSVKGYYRLVTGADRAIGRILEALETKGVLENTVIVFSSDNGIMNGEHGLAGKWLMYEESIRLPLIVRDPRMDADKRGKTVEAMALNIDLSPTLLELAGVPKPDGVQGKSLMPLVRGETPEWRTEFFYEHHFGSKNRAVPIPAVEGVRTEDWKYARYIDEEPLYEELYHVRSDTKEQVNLAGSPEHGAELKEMREKWRIWRDQVRPLAT